MWKDLWTILKQGETLLDDARAEAIEMLDRAREMFEVVLEATVEEADQGLRRCILDMDKVLNESQKSIRTKVFEHLALSKGRDLLSGLVLTSIVIDLERIGDYTKNVGEIVTWMPGKLDFGPYRRTYESVVDRTRELFQKTRAAWVDRDKEAARANVEFYRDISRDVDGLLKVIIETGAPEDTVEKRIIGLLMLLRYLKRVAAHLKNICTTVTNPFPEIGFRPGKE